jgi:hypothetical protein
VTAEKLPRSLPHRPREHIGQVSLASSSWAPAGETEHGPPTAARSHYGGEVAISDAPEVASAVAAALREHDLAEAELRAGPNQADDLVADVSLWSLCLPERAFWTGILEPDDLCLGRFDLVAPVRIVDFVFDLFAALEREGFVRNDVYPSERCRRGLVGYQRSWRICRDDLPLEQMSDPEPPSDPELPGAEHATGRELTLQDLRRSDLFSWFNLQEGRQSTPAPDLTRVELNPVGFSRSIELAFLLGPSDVLAGASLGLERCFVDEHRANLAAATDLVASLLGFLATADPFLSHVARQLEAAGLEAAGALTRGYDPPTLDPYLLPLLHLFLKPHPGRQSLRGQKVLRVGNLPRARGGWFGLLWGPGARFP